MLTKLLFVLYAGCIPLVPLWGAEKYAKERNRFRCSVCWIVFAVQVFISLFSIIEYI